MAWVKIPAEHHPIFLAAVPKDPRVTTLKMFGGIAAKVNGRMFAGLFGKSFIVKLADADREEALALDGAEPFDPMGNGRVMSETVLMPEDAFGEAQELPSWLRRALDHAVALPGKVEKGAKPTTTTKPAAAKPGATKPAISKPAATKPTAKPAAKSTKPATKTKPAAKPTKAAAKVKRR